MKNYTPKYFTFDEFTRSATASANGVGNIPGPQETSNIYSLIEHVLDPVRKMWGSPIIVSSGYRCPKLNALVNGARNSSHMTGQAADITVGGKVQNWQLYTKIKSSDVPFTKLIFERNKKNVYWIHISYIEGNSLRKCYIYDPKTKTYEIDKT